MSFVMDKSKCMSKKGSSLSVDMPYLTEIQWAISNLPFVQNKYYQQYANHLAILRSS